MKCLYTLWDILNFGRYSSLGEYVRCTSVRSNRQGDQRIGGLAGKETYTVRLFNNILWYAVSGPMSIMPLVYAAFGHYSGWTENVDEQLRLLISGLS